MSRKRVMRLFRGSVGAGAALLALSATAYGFEYPALGTAPASPVQQPEARIHVAQDAAQAPVSYSNDQADRGEEDFEENCVECHGEDLRGGLLGGPPLRGASFEQKFANGAPAGALFDFISTTMPPDSPGRFSASTYADLMAYILKRNGFPAGAELPSDSDALYNLTMTK